MKISVIVATYNRVDALSLVLQSLETQTDSDFEVIIADDGSRDETKDFIVNFIKSSKLKITHVWHEDQGFRLALIRNLATAAAAGEYLIFLDGDCVVQPDFVARHRQLAQKGFLVTGSRILLNEKLTQDLLSWPNWSFARFTENLILKRLNGGINKYWPLKIKLGNGSWRNYKKFVWRRIKGCNLACWKADADAINGFDETMTGWGHEDADFVFRMQHQGIRRKSGSWSTEVLHLFHKMHDQSNAAENARRVREKNYGKGLIRFLMSHFSKFKPKKVLFIATRQIGDVLVTTPLISKARELWPDAEFHFLGYQGKMGMLHGNPDIAEVIEAPDRPSFSEYLSLFNRLFQRYDLAVVTQPSDRAYLYGLVAAFRRVGVLGGHPQGKDAVGHQGRSKSEKQNAWKKWISMHTVDVDYFKQHVITEKLRLLRMFL